MAEMRPLVIPVQLDIDRRTADACARLVELYANQNGCELLLQRLPDGRFTLTLAGGRDDS